MLGDSLMQVLRSTRTVFQQTQAVAPKASVPKPEFKAWMVTPWSKTAASIHATTDILSAPVWGSTKPDEFITISGMRPPKAPTIISVPTIAGSNIPQGGVHLP